MTAMIWILIACFALLIFYYIRLNKQKHADPANRACAMELCELMVEKENVSDGDILEIYLKHERTGDHARQVSTMVGEILSDAGGGMRPSIAAGRRVREVGQKVPGRTIEPEPPLPPESNDK